MKADIGIILRCDNLIKNYNLKKVSISTKFGDVDRMYIGEVHNKSIAVLYGRFKGVRTTSEKIDYEQNQAAFNKLGVKTIIGSFIVGAISSQHRVGEIFIPNDYVGLGNFSNNFLPEKPFKNVDMYRPFCDNLIHTLKNAAHSINIPIKSGIYLSFNGYPRIETKAELDFYEKNGWDIVGQTLDVEATMARQDRCHYVAICALTDDILLRQMFTTNPDKARQIINSAKQTGRLSMERIILTWIIGYSSSNAQSCPCLYNFSSEQNFFNYKPPFEQ